MSDIQRFVRFIKKIAECNLWEYEDGTPMREDAMEFLDAMGEWPACCDICQQLWRDCICRNDATR